MGLDLGRLLDPIRLQIPNCHDSPCDCKVSRQVTVAADSVIWNIIPNQTPVIPAKAGIQSVDSAFPKGCRVDSRFRGNDCGLERSCLANDITAAACGNLEIGQKNL